MATLYDTDVVAWAGEQAELLRARRWHALDLANIVEEIEDVGKRERGELQGRMALLISHLLKWKYQPGLRGSSWAATIRVQRERSARRIARTSSLKHCLSDPDWVQDVWHDALVLAIAETHLHDLPLQPLWGVDDILDVRFFPD